jgi:hypothetical protein
MTAVVCLKLLPGNQLGQPDPTDIPSRDSPNGCLNSKSGNSVEEKMYIIGVKENILLFHQPNTMALSKRGGV